ncbi:probably inactive leucine-rich repeat receptor-like protein kinase [Tanacetum coccineum]
MKRNSISSMLLGMLIILVCFVSSDAVQTDIDCLRSIKNTLQDPQHLLSSWDFNNSTEGFICRFTGVECWSLDESKVFNMHLSHMGLRGPFPMGLGNCTSLIGLNLSSNHLTGPIPSNLADAIPFVTSLDLSNNNLSGPILASLGNCYFLNVLRLDNNHLTCQIPPELGGLNRLKEFSVANNRLIGKVPFFGIYSASADSYANNLGLCGGPLGPCKKEGHKNLLFSGFEVGFPASTVLIMLLMFWRLPMSMNNMTLYRMIKKMKGRRNHLIPGTPVIVNSLCLTGITYVYEQLAGITIILPL